MGDPDSIPPPKIYGYHLADSANAPQLATALAHLQQPSCFRTSLPLARRLRFGKRHENTYLITNLPTDTPAPNSNDAEEAQEPWLCAFVDRACRPETEVWLFGSWEVETPHSADGVDEVVVSLLRALIRKIKTLPLAPSIHGSEAAASMPKDTMLWGAIHERTIPYLHTLSLLPEDFGRAYVNSMFLFRVADLPEPQPLPPGLRWGKLRSEHFPLVRSRTKIPRQDRTLGILCSLAIYPSADDGGKAQPIAWVFVGLDSSLTTLHVETSHRRLGLARALTGKLFREEMEGVWKEGVEEDAKLAFGYVQEGNEASKAMCRNLGGRSEWEVYWVRANVGKI